MAKNGLFQSFRYGIAEFEFNSFKDTIWLLLLRNTFHVSFKSYNTVY